MDSQSESDDGPGSSLRGSVACNAVKNPTTGLWNSLIDTIAERVQIEVCIPGSVESLESASLACKFGERFVPCVRRGDVLSCDAPAPKPCRGRYAREKETNVAVLVQSQPKPFLLAEATFDYTAVPFWRKPSLEGRFSGRLPTKEDERRLVDEVRLLAPLLGGGGKRGDKSLLTLAKLVRGIACGEVRAHCEAREHELQALRTRIAVLDAMQQQHGGASGSRDGLSADTSSALAAMDAENARLRAALTDRDTQIVELQKQLREKEQLVSNAFKAAAAGTAGNKSDDGGGNVKKRMRGSESDVAVAATAATAGTSVGAAPNAPPGVPPQLSQPPNQPQLLLPHMLPMSVLPVALQPPSLSSTLLPHQLSMGLQPRPITPTVSPQQLMQQLGVAVQQQAQPQVQQTPPQAASPTMPAPPVRKQQLQEQQERLRQLQQQQQQQQHMLEQQLAQAQAQQLQLQLLLQARAQQEGSVGQEPLQNVGQPLAILPPPAVSALTGIHILDLSQAPQPAPSAASPSQGQAPDQPANTALLSKLEHLAQQWQPQPQQAQAGDQAHRQEGEQMQRQAGEQEQEPEGEQARGQGGEQQGGPSPDGAAQVDAMEMHLPNFRRFSRNSLTISLPPLSPSLMDLFGDLDDSAGVDMVQAVHQLAQHTQLQLLQQAQIDQQGVPEAAQGQLAQQQAPQGPSPQPAHQQLQPSPSPDGHQGQQATSAHTPSLGNHHQGSQATAELVSGQDGCAAAANTGASPGLQQLTSPVLGVVRDRSPQRMKRVASAMSATSTDVPPEAQTQPLSRDFQGASQPGSVCAQGEDATMAMPGRSPQGGTTQPSHDAPEQLSQQQQQVRSHAGGHSGALQAQTEGPAPLQSSQLSLQHLLHASQAGGEQRGYPRPATPQAQAQAQQTQSQGVPSTWQGLAPVGVTLNADLAQRMESMVAATPPTTELGVWGGQEPQQPQQQQQLHHPQPQQLLHQLPGNFVGAVGPGLGTSFAELLGQRSLQPNITPPSDRVTNAMSILRMGSAPPLCALPPLPMISAPMPSAAPVGHSAHHPMSRASPALSIHRTASPQLPMPQQPPCPMPALGLPPGSMHLPPANMPSPAQLLSDARAALQGVDSRVMHQLGTDIQQGTGASGGAPNSGHGAAPPLGPGSSLVLALAAQMEDMQRLQAQQAQQAEQQLRQLEHLRQALMSHVGTNSGSKSSS